MSSDLAIRFEGVGKEYHVGAAQSGGSSSYQSAAERLAGAVRHPLRTARGFVRRPPSETFWALRDVSFDVQRGEVVGVIGRNGAGKSTLLKILSQITRPTTGQIAVYGRVGSLLEVGTGFHPELTGRENVFLNGSIMGMTQREVRSKFDEIVAFSEVERFLDTPVKQYSSGMYTRLAFAVAAHLDPEILVVDEVLAVGDAEFQRKCLGKMQQVAGGGRTVLFVSHNMAAVSKLCHSCVVLSSGSVATHAATEPALSHYMAMTDVDELGKPIAINSPDRLEGELSVEAIGQDGDDWTLELQFKGFNRVPRLGVGVSVAGPDGVTIAKWRPFTTRLSLPTFAGVQRLRFTAPGLLRVLPKGSYTCGVWFAETGVEMLAEVERLARFDAPSSDVHATGVVPLHGTDGFVCTPLQLELG
ncbi:Teichoic acids export ATP-binding protein TagH [Botrimarina colliarenosi]|uniref:Teichoic acids export ATP-binding protein TagH n=1 Tax=Botrimarina colliarenosi TaxID=2528001 RepID=A0A5C6AD38_9BACT|nr:ABC transporter ATP-binding protein [Botrimarina colliarenosi]TWT97972.1 Teichoic acids export ATP-binding protein TagH [Botrimarina colliarenosi]